MQKTKRIKVVFDTNEWISFILGGKSKIIRDIILDKRVEIYTSDELTAELFETLKEKKFAKSLIANKFYQI
jgi:putative PIN family toxin of toxin-antitoxin system